METMTIEKLTNLLSSLPKDMTVNVFDYWNDEYFNNIYVWEEGHDYRHFINLTRDKWNVNNKNTTVGKVLRDLKGSYTKHSNEYRDNIVINVDAPLKYRSSTCIINTTIKNGELFLKGDKPSWTQ